MLLTKRLPIKTYNTAIVSMNIIYECEQLIFCIHEAHLINHLKLLTFSTIYTLPTILLNNNFSCLMSDHLIKRIKNVSALTVINLSVE